MYEKKEVERVFLGVKKELGTDWPRESVVHRIRDGKRTYWLATYNICNGVPTGSRRFATKAEAVKSLHTRSLPCDTPAVCRHGITGQELFHTTLPAGATYAENGRYRDALGHVWLKIESMGYLYEIEEMHEQSEQAEQA